MQMIEYSAVLLMKGKDCILLQGDFNRAVATAWLAGEATTVEDVSAVEQVMQLRDQGISNLVLYYCNNSDQEQDDALHITKEMVRVCDLPFYIGGSIKRFEDIKKMLYAGAFRVWCDSEHASEQEAFLEGEKRFGTLRVAQIPFRDKINQLLTGATAEDAAFPFEPTEVSFSFADVQVNAQGLLPVVAQDYRTGEVLMVAYMNEEAFRMTVETGRMTYYSRSRDELWVKGLTSGNFQYVKSLALDCDYDTLLAKVYPVGPACHTGANSCFFRSVLEKPKVERTNPHKVLEDLMATILDRKENPREGSYTNYLFDKGVDKILKKVGEEATEIVIAAKNPNAEEIKYEIADFLYHVAVLMAEKGISWDEVMIELANR